MRCAFVDATGGVATCSSRGIAGKSDAESELVFAHEGEELTLRIAHCARSTVSTGGHVWSCSRDLARWLYARRTALAAARILELGCGLALPSLVAARSGADMCLATDDTATLLEHVCVNAARNECASRVATRLLDFTRRDEILRTAAEHHDLVIFADCVYGGGMGSKLPHAIAELLLANDDAPCVVGAFASDISMRPGIHSFWEQAAEAGLHWQELPLHAPGEEVDQRSGRLFAFSATAQTRPRAGWGDEEAAEEALEPLFADDEGNEAVAVAAAAEEEEVTPPPPARRELVRATSTCEQVKLREIEDAGESATKRGLAMAPR